MSFRARLRWSLTTAILLATAGAAYPWPSWLKHTIFAAGYYGYQNAKLTTLVSFSTPHRDDNDGHGGGGGGGGPGGNNGLGAVPLAGLVAAENAFFGTTSNPGSAYVLFPPVDTYETWKASALAPLNKGTSTPLTPTGTGLLVGTEPNDVFLLSTHNGKTEKTIILNGGGSIPVSGLTLAPDGSLFGTATGGQYGYGLVYRLTPSHGGYTPSVVHAFKSALEGEYPSGGLAIDQYGRLYGATAAGGNTSCSYRQEGHARGCGVLYRLTPSAGGNAPWTETILHYFGGGADGAGPGDVIVDKTGKVYGATVAGGTKNYGTVYEAIPGSSGAPYSWNVLWGFTGGKDGEYPNTKLAIDPGGALYGTAQGGAHGKGIVFILVPPYLTYDWTFTVMHSFDGQDGAQPSGGLILDKAGTLYGVTAAGGNCNNGGTVYKLVP